MKQFGLKLPVSLLGAFFVAGCHGTTPGISSCLEGFTSGDMYGGEERFVQADEYKSTCPQSCKELHPESIGVTESLKEKYNSGTGKYKNKCWCEFGDPKLDKSNKNYQTCFYGCPLPALVPRKGPLGTLTCSGHVDPYFNIPKTYEDIHIQIGAKGGVRENGELVFKEELATLRTDPKKSECYMSCPPGYMPNHHTHCIAGVWSYDPEKLLCIPSPCGVPTAPMHAKLRCYGNPSTCYLTCDPGYATMSNTTITCQNGKWNMDSESIECEVAVALFIGGRVFGEPFLESCKNAEVFSPVDQVCSTQVLPPLNHGVSRHTTHLLNGEILQCGGDDAMCYSNDMDNATKSTESCFKMLENNTWALHSVLPEDEDAFSRKHNIFLKHSLISHMGAIQQGTLQLVGGINREAKSTLVLNGNTWIEGRKPSLPPAAFWFSQGNKQCLVETSPTTFVVIGGSMNIFSQNRESVVMEFNSFTGEWSELPEIPEGRHNHACALVTTRSGPGIMVAGGINHDRPIDMNSKEFTWMIKSVYLLDLGTKKWYPAGNLTYRREQIELVVLGEKVIAMGTYRYWKEPYSYNENNVEEYVIPCRSLKECSPSQQGNWTLTQRQPKERTFGSVLPVPASRFGCTG